MGIGEFLEKTTGLLFLVLVVVVSDYPDEHPSVENSPGELWENSDREGERNHLYEDLF